MSLTVSDFSAAAETATIRLGGREVVVRALTAAEVDSIRAVFPEPGPEMIPNPIIGHGEPKLIPADWTPPVRKARAGWIAHMKTAFVALAIGLEGEGGLRAVVPALRAKLSDIEIEYAYNVASDLSDPLAAADGTSRLALAKKNLSAPTLLPEDLVRAMVDSLYPAPTG